VLWRCWLGGRKGIRPVKTRVVGYWHGYLSGLRCRLACNPADATASLPLTVSCFSKIQIGFTFLVLAHPGSPGKRAIKQVCVCVMSLHHCCYYAYKLQLLINIALLIVCWVLISCYFIICCAFSEVPSVVWHCCLGARKSNRPVKIEWWGVGVVLCIWSSWCHCFPKPHHLLPHLNPDLLYLSGTGLLRLSWKRGRWTGVV